MLTTQPPVQPMNAPPAPGQRHPRAAFQAVMGPNGIFTVFLAYWIATGLQDTYLKLGLIIATALAAGHVFIGSILLMLNGRRVFPYVLEICMLVIYPVLLGVTLASDSGYETVKRDYNFIVNSALAGVTLISMIITWPLGIQHVQEMIPWAHAGHEDVLVAGYWTSGALALSFIMSCLLYLIPVCRDTYNDHLDPLNLVFRLIMPEVLTFLAVLFTRFWPAAVVAHLQGTEVYDWADQVVVLAYPPGAGLLNKPKVLDPAMMEPYPNPKLPGLGNNPLSSLQSSYGHGKMPPGMVLTGVPVPMDPLAAYYAKKNNAVSPAPPLSTHHGLEHHMQHQHQHPYPGGSAAPPGSGGLSMLPAGMVHPTYEHANQQHGQGTARAMQHAPPGTVRVPIPEGAVIRPVQDMASQYHPQAQSPYQQGGANSGGNVGGVGSMNNPQHAAVMSNQQALMKSQHALMGTQQAMMGNQQQLMQAQQAMMGNQQQMMNGQQSMLGGIQNQAPAVSMGQVQVQAQMGHGAQGPMVMGGGNQGAGGGIYSGGAAAGGYGGGSLQTPQHTPQGMLPGPQVHMQQAGGAGMSAMQGGMQSGPASVYQGGMAYGGAMQQGGAAYGGGMVPAMQTQGGMNASMQPGGMQGSLRGGMAPVPGVQGMLGVQGQQGGMQGMLPPPAYK